MATRELRSLTGKMIYIKEFLEKQKLDGLLFVADSFCDLDVYYLSGFLSRDRFTVLAADDIHILVSSMELGRAKNEAVADVASTSHYRIMDKLKMLKRPDDAYQKVLEEFLCDNQIKHLGVPFRFPVGIYQQLCKKFKVSVIESPVSRLRAVKTQKEIDSIQSVQRRCEASMRLAVDLIANSEPRGDFLYRNGQPLNAEDIRNSIEMNLIENGCEAVDTIVAGGMIAADPHARGMGPLPANAPIVIDIFPRSTSTRYFADMSRTIIKGEASIEVKEIYEAVLDAQSTGLKSIRADVSGQEVHRRVCEVLKEHGYPEREGCGFTHSTGHGVGLNIHEKPSLNEAGETLEVNNVVAVEPGLYYPHIGGVRLEDLVVVEKNGCRNLTHFERRLVI